MATELNYRTKYELIREHLLEEIRSKLPSDKLAGEVELAERFAVNRGTVSKVLASLSSEGLIVRKPRVGSIVSGQRERRLSHCLCVLVERRTGHLYEKLSGLLLREIQSNGFFPLTVDLGQDDDPKSVREQIDCCFEKIFDAAPEFVLVDGIGSLPFKLLYENAGRIRNLVFVNKRETALPFKATNILSDYSQGGYLGVRHLLEKGHRKIRLLTASPPSSSPNINELRLKGAAKALREAGLRLEEEHVIAWRDETMFRTVLKDLFASPRRRPTALFAFADSLVRRAQAVLEPLGVHPGVDYQMVGYFDTPYATEFSPALTSISINEQGIAEQFGEVLRNGRFEKKTYLVEPVLTVRESTAGKA